MARSSPVKDFILSLPRDLPVADLIAQAKRAKLGEVSKSYVSKVRCDAPASTWAKPVERAVNGHALPGAPEPKPRRNAALEGSAVERTLSTPHLKPVTEAELKFRQLLVSVGTDRAQAFIDAYRAADEAALRSM